MNGRPPWMSRLPTLTTGQEARQVSGAAGTSLP